MDREITKEMLNHEKEDLLSQGKKLQILIKNQRNFMSVNLIAPPAFMDIHRKVAKIRYYLLHICHRLLHVTNRELLNIFP